MPESVPPLLTYEFDLSSMSTATKNTLDIKEARSRTLTLGLCLSFYHNYTFFFLFLSVSASEWMTVFKGLALAFKLYFILNNQDHLSIHLQDGFL